ncbi:MAG: hypothetical protein QXW79_00735 [Thermoplasmata archaeon]
MMFLKSINGRRCLSRCYPKDTTYLHPIFLTGISSQMDTCAIDPIYSKDSQYYGMIVADKCNLDDNKKYKIPSELESILVAFHFNPYDFLTGIYGLHSFDEVIRWTLENDYLPIDTIKRVHNCAWKVFGKDLEEISNIVIEYYYDISKTYWLKNYTKIIQKKYSFDLVKNIGSVSNTFEEIYEIVLSKIFTFPFFTSCIKKYIKKNKNQWDTIHSHYDKIKKYVFQLLIKNIESKAKK